MSDYKVLTLMAKNHSNIIPVRAAVSDRASRMSMSNQSDTPWSRQTLEADTGNTRAITIPHMIAMRSAFAPMVVKVDIEGLEANLLRSGTEWVDDLPLLVSKMHDWVLPGSTGPRASAVSSSAQHEQEPRTALQDTAASPLLQNPSEGGCSANPFA